MESIGLFSRAQTLTEKTPSWLVELSSKLCRLDSSMSRSVDLELKGRVSSTATMTNDVIRALIASLFDSNRHRAGHLAWLENIRKISKFQNPFPSPHKLSVAIYLEKWRLQMLANQAVAQF